MPRFGREGKARGSASQGYEARGRGYQVVPQACQDLERYSLHRAKSDIRYFKKSNKKEIDMKISIISKSNKNTQELKLNQSQLENVMKQLLKFDTINEENKSLVLKLIDKIIIDDDKINIKYKFNNLEL